MGAIGTKLISGLRERKPQSVPVLEGPIPPALPPLLMEMTKLLLIRLALQSLAKVQMKQEMFPVLKEDKGRESQEGMSVSVPGELKRGAGAVVEGVSEGFPMSSTMTAIPAPEALGSDSPMASQGIKRGGDDSLLPEGDSGKEGTCSKSR